MVQGLGDMCGGCSTLCAEGWDAARIIRRRPVEAEELVARLAFGSPSPRRSTGEAERARHCVSHTTTPESACRLCLRACSRKTWRVFLARCIASRRGEVQLGAAARRAQTLTRL